MPDASVLAAAMRSDLAAFIQSVPDGLAGGQIPAQLAH